MRDAMNKDAAVFEPEEVAVLEAAFRTAKRRSGLDGHAAERQTECSELARLIHNLGRSRIQLKKRLSTPADADRLADEALEVFSYIQEAPDAVLVESRAASVSTPRAVTMFPAEVRTVPQSPLRP